VRTFEYFRNDFVPAFSIQSAMNGNAVLDLAEHAVERVGGVGNVEFRIPLTSEEAGEV